MTIIVLLSLGALVFLAFMLSYVVKTGSYGSPIDENDRKRSFYRAIGLEDDGSERR